MSNEKAWVIGTVAIIFGLITMGCFMQWNYYNTTRAFIGNGYQQCSERGQGYPVWQKECK